MKRTKLLLITVLVLLCGCLLFCGCETAPVEPDMPEEPGMPDEPGTPDEPKNDLYTFEFLSNGDGTCYITNIVVSEDCTEDFTLVIPEKSPEGDVVVGITDWLSVLLCNHEFENLPLVMTEETFDVILAKLQGNGLDAFHIDRFKAFYIRLDMADNENEHIKQELLREFPLAAKLSVFYCLDSASTDVDRAWMSDVLTEAAYTMEDKDQAYEALLTLLKANLPEEEYYFSGWHIYPRAFSHLTAVEFPDSLVAVRSAQENSPKEYRSLGFFAGCEALTRLTNYSTGEKFVLEDEVLYSADKTLLAGVFKYYHAMRHAETGEYISSKFVIPDTVKSIGWYALSGCSFLDEVVIPYGVEAIQNNAFEYCRRLIDVKLPESVTSIHAHAFQYCSKLANIDFPESMELISGYALYRCESLVKVVLPNGIKEIWSNLFEGCTQLQEVVIPDSVIKIWPMAFWDCPSLEMLIIPKNVSQINRHFGGDIAKVKIASENPYYCIEGDCLIHIETQTAIIIGGADIPEGIKHIGDSAFMFTADTICVPYGVTTIGSAGFGSETNIHLYLPNTLTKIDISFSDNEFLKTITFIGTEEEWNAIEKGEGWENSESKCTIIFADVVDYYLEQARERWDSVTSPHGVIATITIVSEQLPNYIERCQEAKLKLENVLADSNASESSKNQFARVLRNELARLRRAFGNAAYACVSLHDEYEFFSRALQIFESQAGAAGAEAAKKEVAGYKDNMPAELETCKEVLSQMYAEVMKVLQECHSNEVDSMEEQQIVQELYDEWLACID